jgi:MFS family permease
MTSMLILSLLGLAIGLTTVNAGDAAASGTLPDNSGTATAIWGALSAIISFFLGGFVAGRTASVFSRGWGSLNGAMVFLIGVPLMLWLASQGLGAMMGSFSAFAGDIANNAQNTAQNTSPVEVARTAEQVRNGAWGSLLAALLGLGAATLGGSMGTRRHVELEADTGKIHD